MKPILGIPLSRSDLVINLTDCVPPIDASMVHESLEEGKVADSVECFIFGESLMEANASDIHCKYNHHLMSELTRYCYQTRFVSRAIPYLCLAPLRLAVVIECHASSMTKVCSRCILCQQITRRIHNTHFQLTWAQFMKN